MNRYMSGTRVQSSAVFTDVDGDPADPSTITFKYRAGSGAIVTDAAPVRDGAGTYHSLIDTSGWTGPDHLLYTCEWIGTGTVEAIGADYFEVEPPVL